MQVREFGEDALVAAFAEIYREHDGVEVGIGDDGAIVASVEPHQVITTDIATEGIHFNRAWSSARDIGAKIAIANLADIFAMGGVPKYLTVAISVSGEEEVSFILEIARGIEEIAHAHQVSVVGGDVVAGQNLMISITAIGAVTHPVLRSGAEVGDEIFITRGTGKSLAGLLLLTNGLATLDSPYVKMFQRPDFHPEDLMECGFASMSALMDVSDGLLTDLDRLAKASGVGIDITIDSTQLSYLEELSEQVNLSALELFLRSGEEHSFIVAVHKEKISKVPQKWIRIGEATAGGKITLGGKDLSEITELAEKSWHW